MNNKNILEIEIQKEINCSKQVALWNYWDHEHLDEVHDGYKKSNILYDKKNFMFRIDEIKVPLIPLITFSTPIFMVQDNENDLVVYAIQMGVLSKTVITINEITERKCKIKMNYKFYLNGWRMLLKPILKILIPKWNQKVWDEDYSIKIRRQKMLDMNFRDFVGLPKNIEERFFKNIKQDKFELPIPRPKNSSRDLHPLSIKNKKNKY